MPEDAEKITAWLNDLEITLPLGDEVYTTVSLDKMQANIHEDNLHRNNIFAIVDLETDALIGRCLLFDVNPVDRCAMLGIFIGEKRLWGKGLWARSVEAAAGLCLQPA